MIRRTFAPRALAATAIAVAMIVGSSPVAAERIFVTDMNEDKSLVCDIGSTATGSGTFTLDPAGKLTFNITFTGLSSPELKAHIHGPAPQGSPADPLFTLPPGSPKIGSVTLTAAQQQDLQDELYYVNIHSDDCLGGEIRGQIFQASVGGVAELPEVAEAPLETTGSSSGSAGLLAGVIAAVVAGAAALGGAVWYVRRRPA